MSPLLFQLETLELPSIHKVFMPLMHTLFIIWTTSQAFNNSTRMGVFLRKICNRIIERAQAYTNKEILFREIPQEGVKSMTVIIDTCTAFRHVYSTYQSRVADEVPTNPWKLHPVVFQRLDAFHSRCVDIRNVLSIIVDFGDLEKLEVGGNHGSALAAVVEGMNRDMEREIMRLKEAHFEILDIDTTQEAFGQLYSRFAETVKTIERRLSGVVVQMLEDATTSLKRFQVLDGFHELLERDVVRNDLNHEHHNTIIIFSEELGRVLNKAMDGVTAPPLYHNMPPRAGAVAWARGLLERVRAPMVRLRRLDGGKALQNDEGKEVDLSFQALERMVFEFEKRQATEWAAEIDVGALDKLKQFLLLCDSETKLLTVNFPAALVCLLREIKYFVQLKVDVPSNAMDVYQKAETFRQHTANLETIVRSYNRMMISMLDVERPLLQHKLENIDKILSKGISQLNWKSASISDFITQAMFTVRETAVEHATLQANVKAIETVLARWRSGMVPERAPTRTFTVPEFHDFVKQHFTSQLELIAKEQEEIHSLVAHSAKVLKVASGAPQWLSYVNYIADILVFGLVDVVKDAVTFMCDQVDPANIHEADLQPLVEVRLELQPPHLVFVPDLGLGKASARGLGYIFRDLSKAVINASLLVRRVCAHGDGDYLPEIQGDVGIRAAMQRFAEFHHGAIAECDTFTQTFEPFKRLWETDPVEQFQEFLETEKDVGEESVSLVVYDRVISQYEAIETEIANLQSEIVACDWLRVDASPLTQALRALSARWTYQFKGHLVKQVVTTVTELTDFIEQTNTIFSSNIEDEETEKLMEMLTALNGVRTRVVTEEETFEPLRQIISLLKKHDVNVDTSLLQSLETAPVAWEELLRQAELAVQKHESAITDQASQVSLSARKLESRVDEFVAMFHGAMPYDFSTNYADAYDTIDRFHHAPPDDDLPHGSLVILLDEADRMEHQQELFEQDAADFSSLRWCDDDAVNLKQVWDMVSMVLNEHADWKNTLWNDIDVDVLAEKNKKLIKDVRGLPGTVHQWNCYNGLEATVKNMQTTLPLIADLHDPAMRDRHWKQLMEVMGVNFKMSDSVCLGDLLDLQPYNFVDDVAEIVDRAQKELIIEKQLSKIAAVWQIDTLKFVYWNQKVSELHLLVPPEESVESMEEHAVLLQGLQASKYVQNNAVFREEVGEWLANLGVVDAVLSTWIEVQKKWSNLQAIFIGSADIRVQLPEDTKRFENIDENFKDLMADAVFEDNTLAACLAIGRLERIEMLHELLEKCEKALADYLETKRLAYPRFYFVAAADLVDILSKGSFPHEIMRHIPKCFDNVKSLEFAKDAKNERTKKAIGMYSGEREFVPFPSEFNCIGAVEKWLRDLTTFTHDTIRTTLSEAVADAEDKERHDFIFDWPTQVAIVVLRIRYTLAVSLALQERERPGGEIVLEEYHQTQVAQLKTLADMILTDLTPNQRKTIISVVTIDVHARDVVGQLIEEDAQSATTFTWLSQLRYSMDAKDEVCTINICDYSTTYGYEYVGNCGCLVITPLTDRCYITLTQAMRLCLGGAPAGPAGTGKTETVKDLGRATGIMVYVFNCSDQMDYKSMGQIFKGLSMAGAWGCFDEFNRIDISVLSVVSTQWRCVLDAIRQRKKLFRFEDDEIPLCMDPFPCAFITMNPGYAGRTELPESVKALFRPCAMIVPDMDLISEIMLMSEGFAEGKILAKKFMILYRLNESLLSAQKHYDWKLRAIKTTLNVAGGMRRADPTLSEDKVLLRALRDFNLGKLVADDVQIFMGLLNDLFPKTLELVPRHQDVNFEKHIATAAVALNLQPEALFMLKVSQLRELLDVRWSVFVLGPAGCGKSEMIKTLCKAQAMNGEKTTQQILNPKAVTRNELYGYIHPATREWKDGLISQIFRDLSNITTVPNEYIVLDGDIDPEWIESMNTVMDDNKMLTLASNERIPLTPPMRLLFEIENLREASPATVSRAGIIYMNDTDIGWEPFVTSWIQRRPNELERSVLTKLFDALGPILYQALDKQFKPIVPMPFVSLISSVCCILEGTLDSTAIQGLARTSLPAAQDLVKACFIYSCVWGIGGTLPNDSPSLYRENFDKWFQSQVPFKLPCDSVFDFFVETSTGKLLQWKNAIATYTHDPDASFGAIFVQTVETQRLQGLQDLLVPNRHPVMFVGNGGTGKSTLARQGLAALDLENYSQLHLNLNCFTDSLAMQLTMESALEKKTGRTYGPTGSKKLVYFVDDLNMPSVDKYGTQQPLTLLRQQMDYGFWYDRSKLTLKDIQNVQFVGCLNPKAGSFTIDPRLQRHFCTFAVLMPSQDTLIQIFGEIVDGHLIQFPTQVQNIRSAVVKATVDLLKTVAEVFLPTAVKFHYQFTLRELSKIFEGILRARPEHVATPVELVRLWLHESERVISDRLTTDTDLTRFNDILTTCCLNFFVDMQQEHLHKQPRVFTHFCAKNGTSIVDDLDKYIGASELSDLRQVIEARLAEYNQTNAVMDIVLFDQAVQHVCRITRVLSQPRGNALLLGIGGSGKQSLARLAAILCGYEVFQITVTAAYGIQQFKEDLIALYTRAGTKGIGICFILTEGHIVNEHFLVYINDLLATGNVPDLFPVDTKADLAQSVASEMKQLGIIAESQDQMWDYFIEKTRTFLHTVLCFSPVGDKFRVRARQFPALISCTTIDNFFPWPHEALIAVASRFLEGIENLGGDTRAAVAQHFAFVHQSVNDASAEYFASEHRYNYTTPKTFLDLIGLYKSMLQEKRADVATVKSRLDHGLDKIKSASDQVSALQKALEREMAVVEEKREKTEELLEVVGSETQMVEEQRGIAKKEEKVCAELAEKCAAIQEECENDLAVAEPLIVEAENALATLDKKNLVEMKALASPPQEVADVMAAMFVLTKCPTGSISKDLTWLSVRKALLASPEKLLVGLVEFDKDNVPDPCVTFVERTYMSKENFNPAAMKSKSVAAAGLCAWVVNICKYFRIYQMVEPKRQSLIAANETLEEANVKLEEIRAHVDGLERKLAELTAQFESATEEKNTAIERMDATLKRANLADRLVNGLSEENVRWMEASSQSEQKMISLTGDVTLACAFVAYIGAFDARFRRTLVHDRWLPDIIEREIPMTEGVLPLDVLSDEATMALWSNEGLPTDTLSIQNGAIVTNCKRWPLMIDPQLQGLSWITSRHRKEKTDDVPAEEMMILQLSMPRYLTRLETALGNGDVVLIEGVGETLDAVLEPLLSRSVIYRGRTMYTKLGDKEVEYDPNFRLYLQTKLSNPHYQPEVAAQTTLINFMITQDGLEEQLLALVVNKERNDLELRKQQLLHQHNEFRIKLKQLEDDILFSLSTAEGDILSNVELIEGLEKTKHTAADIKEQEVEAAKTSIEISTARDVYRPVGIRGALLYFIVHCLSELEHVYRFSMAAFVAIFKKGMDSATDGDVEGDNDDANDQVDVLAAEAALGVTLDDGAGGSAQDPSTPSNVVEEADVDREKVLARVAALVDSSCLAVFSFVTQGLFERHKLIFATQLAVRIMTRAGDLDHKLLSFLLRTITPDNDIDNPLREWLPDSGWACVTRLQSESELFEDLPGNLQAGARKYREWVELDRPEDHALPSDIKNVGDFGKLCVMKCLRPDRLPEGMVLFVRNALGPMYSEPTMPALSATLSDDVDPRTPVLFVLCPGVDPVKDVEALAEKLKFTSDNGKFRLVSMGQGQESIAEKCLEEGAASGGWLFLQNVHLTPRWTGGFLDGYVDKLTDVAVDFHLFLSAEPALDVPVGLLQNSVKIVNESPAGLRENVVSAMASFDSSMFDGAKGVRLRPVVFALCFFHAIMLQRRKFGPQGFNMTYPFNAGDLTSCAMVAVNYLDDELRTPWVDMRYIFGEIMYGGHIVDAWDRRLCLAYLRGYFQEDLLGEDGTFELAPGVRPPPVSFDWSAARNYAEGSLPVETPTLFGLHPNAEIGFRLLNTDRIVSNLQALQARDASSGGGGISANEAAQETLNDIMENLPDSFDLADLAEKVDIAAAEGEGPESAAGSASGKHQAASPVEMGRQPHMGAFMQEAERMNILLKRLQTTLAELSLGLKGDLQMSESMDALMVALSANIVPSEWEAVAYPSTRPLASWFSNLLDRHKQISTWADDMALPKSTWVAGFFNPNSFLTATLQDTARRRGWPLDGTTMFTEVTVFKSVEEIANSPTEGIYIHGLVLEGGRWDDKGNALDDSMPKELYFRMPVVHIKAIPSSTKTNTADNYACPVYRTPRRGPSYITHILLGSACPASKWIMAGVALLLDVPAVNTA